MYRNYHLIYPEQRFVVLTPGLSGSDGISALSRMAIRALSSSRTEPGRPRVDVLSLTDAPGSDDRAISAEGVRCVGAGGSKGRFLASALRVAASARPTDVLCLHLHLSPLGLLTGAGGTRLTVFLHGIEAWKSLRRRERLALRRARQLFANSEYTARRFQEANRDFPEWPIRVCHLGVAPDRGDLAQRDRALDHKNSNGSFALIVGRMAASERYKGHDLLIDIWPRVSGEYPHARLVVVGDGDDRERLQARASGLKDQVVFRGRVSDTELVEVYRDCAFFVMPSRDEGFGLVFLEAMRAGRACIGGLGAAAEVIEDGVTGLIVDPTDPEQVLKAVLRFFREAETRERMGRAGAARVAQYFTEAHFRRRFRALLGLAPEAA